ncbi:MAG: LptF/LptG family permease [Pirellulales bacterium]
MTTLIRYLLWELLKTFVMALSVLTVLMLFFAVMTDLKPKDLGFAEILKILPFLLPEAVRNAAQGATLYAVCAVFGKMASNNELVAVKSLGISPMEFIQPALWLAGFLSLGCTWLYDFGELWGTTGIRRVVIESAEEIVYSTLTAQRNYSTSQLSINVKRVTGRTLEMPTLLYQPPNDAPPVTITAKEGFLKTNLKDKSLTILFRDGTAYAGDEVTMTFPETFEQVVPLIAASRESGDDLGPNTQAVLRQRIAHGSRRVAQLQTALKAVGQGTLPNTSVLANEVDQLKSELQSVQDEVVFSRALIHRRWANGFFCLAYAMIGIPVSIRLKSGEALKSFLVCFLPIVIVNQPLHNFSIKLAQAGEAPAWFPWFGNFVLMAIGALLMRKAVKN